MYYPIWVKFGTRELHIMLLLSLERHTFLVGVSEIKFTIANHTTFRKRRPR